MGWNYLSIPKLQRCNRWGLGIDKWFHLTLYRSCDYLSMLGLKVNHVSESGHRYWWQLINCICEAGVMVSPVVFPSRQFLAATKQLYEWYFLSVCLSVRLSVCLSHLFDYVPIIVSSQNFQDLLPMTEVISMQKVKVKGQGHEVTTQLNRFRTVTPVWIHIWWWNDAYSLIMLRRGTLLFFKVIRQISRSQGSKNCRIWPRLGVSGLWLQFQFTNGYEMLHKAWSSIEEVPYCFSRSYVKFQGHPALKIVKFDPNWVFPDCNSSLKSTMATKWCTKLEVA